MESERSREWSEGVGGVGEGSRWTLGGVVSGGMLRWGGGGGEWEGLTLDAACQHTEFEIEVFVVVFGLAELISI